MSINHLDGNTIYNLEVKTVTFVDWDATVLKTEYVGVGGDATPPADPFRSNYIFTGWSGDYTGITANVTITATYVYDPSLYPFTSHIFTSCGKLGRVGPSLAQMQTEYAGESWLSSYFALGAYNGYQKWTVPSDSNFEITVIGANANKGGQGISIKSTVALVKGEKLIIVIGQIGEGGTRSSGGGGGSFVVRENGNVPLVIAGGGGGSYTGSVSSAMAGTSFTTGQTGDGETSNGGTSGAGGLGGVNNSAYGAGGGGFLSAGGSAPNCSAGAPGGFNNGLLGGGACDNAYGGFGGGGGSHGNSGGGGGGGGYSGGGGQGHVETGAGGGGSYSITTMVIVGVNNDDIGNGKVIITKV